MKKKWIACFFFSIICGLSALAQTYPPDATSFANGKIPSQPMPGYKLSITDATFGTTITRVADKTAFGSTNNVNGHEYSVMETWNCNGTLMILKYGNYPEMVIDGNTYNIIGRHSTPRGSTWSGTQAYIMYGVSGKSFVKYDLSTKRTTVVKKFDEYSSLDFSGENHISIDDRNTVIYGYKGDSLYLISYDMANNSILASKYMGMLKIGDANPNSINAVQMSQKGNFILVIYKTAGTGMTQGVHLYDKNLNYVRFLFSESGHCDQGVDENGDEVYVGQAGGQREMFKLRYSDNSKTVILSSGKSSFAQHVSCRNFKRPGWCYMSDFAEKYDSDRPMANKLFALKLDGSETVEFFGWARHSSVIDYNRCAFICPSPDGSKVVFRSDWGDTSTDAMINDYVATALETVPDTIAPSAPSGLNTTNMDRTTCTLSWIASTDNIAVTSYEIFIDGIPAGKTNLTTFDVAGLVCGADNSLTVKATDAAGNSSNASSAIVVKTVACDTEAPSTPANVVASEISSTSCKLTWTASTDNVMVTEYYVYNDGVQIDKSNSESITIAEMVCGTSNSFTVAASDAPGNISSKSSPVNVTTSACKNNIALNKTVKFSSQESTNTGIMATDGNTGTRWAASSGASNEWIIVDLAANYNLSGAEIMWEQTSWIYKYKIETSEDSKSWTLALDKTANTFSGQIETVEFNAFGKRYIKLTNTGWGNGGFWTSLFEFKVFGDASTDVKVNSQNREVSVYPNPANTNITISNIEPNSNISIFSVDGKLIYSSNTLNAGELNLSVRDWNSGLYLVKIKNEKDVILKHVLVGH